MKRNDYQDTGMSLWLRLLPDANILRASLPLHWSKKTLDSARCTALDLAVESAYFARLEALADLQAAHVKMVDDADDDDNDDDMLSRARDVQDWWRLSENALDIVKTRSCRVVLDEHIFGGMDYSNPPLRLLVPVFDLINHGGPTEANAEFRLETTDIDNKEERLVVRATRDLDVNEQVLIDYGGVARPAWKCLTSYGFVPPFQPSKEDNNGDNDNDDAYDNEEEHVAEVFIGGVRYEVGPTTIPQDMVANANAEANASMDREAQAAAQAVYDNVDTLTPDIAIGLAQRMSHLASQLLQMDAAETQEPSEQDDDNSTNNESPEQILSSKLAASLRLNQHNIIIACSTRLRDWAGGGKET
jgi:hypothetical protein